MKPYDQPHGLCSLDPITLTGLAIGGLAASGAFGGSSAATPAPAAQPVTPPTPTTAAPPAQNPVGTQKSAASTQASQPSFFGAAATPNQSSGSKTLLGQ